MDHVSQELEFQLTHMKVAGIGFGNPAKPMILAIHGWLDNAQSFQALSSYLPEYYIVAIDLAGHGLSSHRSPDAHYHLVDFVHDIHQLVLSQNWTPFVILGHSLGGIVASLYASAFPKQVKQLISIESIGPFTQQAGKSASQLNESIQSRITIKQGEAKPVRSLALVIKARAIAGRFSEDVAKILMQRNMREQNGQWFFNSDKRLRTFSSLRMTEEQAEAFMRNIKCPVLVITGDKGYRLVAQAVKVRLPWFSNAEHRICSGHHHLHMDNSQQIASRLIEFLSKSG